MLLLSYFHHCPPNYPWEYGERERKTRSWKLKRNEKESGNIREKKLRETKKGVSRRKKSMKAKWNENKRERGNIKEIGKE